jgi:glycosyltransferase involved in cell wall biosynthesis
MRIVVFAYACEPASGSEPGAGWAWARIIAGLGDAWVLTRANNRDVIEAALPSCPERDRLHFVYLDLPRWARTWKRGQRGIRLYYTLWQVLALRTARRLHRELRFDVAWHLTMANVWLGASAAYLPTRFVYGPVGGGVRTSWRLLPALGAWGATYEVLRATARATARLVNPLARTAWTRAEVILVQNPETRGWLPRRHRSKAHVLPNAVIGDEHLGATKAGPHDPPVALFAGNLLPLKGVALAIRAMVDLPGWRLVICGRGKDEHRLRRLADRLDVADRVEFRGWVPRDRLFDIMRDDADVFLFPSLHDQSPWVVAEALACGLPVVCLEEGGSTVLGGFGVRRTTVRRTAADLAAAVRSAVRTGPSIVNPVDERSRRAALVSILDAHGVLTSSGTAAPQAR